MGEGRPSALWSKTGQALGWLALLAVVAMLAPVADWMRWWPDDAVALVPRVYRGESVEAAPLPGDEGEGQLDEAVLALAEEAAAPPVERSVVPPEAADEVPDALEGAGGGDDGGDDDGGSVVVAAAPLPPAPEVRTTSAGIPLLAIEDPQGAMNRFYAALDRTAAGAEGAVTRVLHYGDSLVMGDYVTQTVRRLLQKKFGDGGHGFVLAGLPWPWYRRDNLKLAASDGWKTYRLTTPTIRDGFYGLGGSTFTTNKGGEWVRYEPNGDELGTAASKFQVFYLAQPGGGDFQMQANDRELVVQTKADKPAARVAEVTLPEGKHVFRLRTQGNGAVRLFGAVVERGGPGVVYDSLGINGARASLLTRYNAAHWHEQIRLRRPDLLILHFGTNESQDPQMGAKRYREELSAIVGQVRQALPGVSCLIVSPLDRADRDEATGELTTRPVVKRIVQVQREVAYAQGCAFWNTWQAMGGEGSMAKWMRTGLGGGDLTHPTPRGADRIGAMLFAALMDGHHRYHGTANR